MKYFTIKELCVSKSYPDLVSVPSVNTDVYNNLVKLIETLLDPIRQKLGKPITVSSGYRPVKLNNAVGGSKTSAHLTGLAADVHTGNNDSDNLKIVDALLSLNIPFDQVIIEYPKFDSSGRIVSAKWIHIGLSKTTNRKQLLYYHNCKYNVVKKNTNFTYFR